MYDVQNLDLSAVTNVGGETLVDRGTVATELALLALATDASFELKFGTSPWFTVPAPFTMKPTGSSMTAGVYWRNLVAQPGIKAQLIISHDGDLSPLLA